MRKLNQPFEWHSPGPGDNVNSDNSENGSEKQSNDTQETKKKPSTCRNSVQGKIWIADDQGRSKNPELF